MRRDVSNENRNEVIVHSIEKKKRDQDNRFENLNS